MMRFQRNRRRGYAITLVVLFILLFLAILAVGWRRLGASLRLQTVQSMQVQRDQGSVQALALALALLETGLPPADPFVGAVSISTPQGVVSYTVTYTSQGNNTYSVQSVPTPADANPLPLPSTFAK